MTKLFSLILAGAVFFGTPLIASAEPRKIGEEMPSARGNLILKKEWMSIDGAKGYTFIYDGGDELSDTFDTEGYVKCNGKISKYPFLVFRFDEGKKGRIYLDNLVSDGNIDRIEEYRENLLFKIPPCNIAL
ncbi:hypothetical protein HY449_01720 [Candidatus Pacearchaeota archaeon]|nr:hypothetical protein [Candidatus Pacearchaeota archaeon]